MDVFLGRARVLFGVDADNERVLFLSSCDRLTGTCHAMYMLVSKHGTRRNSRVLPPDGSD